MHQTNLLLCFILLAVWITPDDAAAQSAAAEKCQDWQDTAASALRDYPLPVRFEELVIVSRVDRENCQLTGYIDSTIGFQMRLPAEDWNGKFLMQGCRAYCGVFMTDDADDALARGYAVATTDMGHKGGVLDAEWAYNNPAAEIDFAYRATLLTTQVATLLVEAYYGTAAERRYLRGCSTGGRQGLLDAQRFPQNYDGIISGAPVAMGRRSTLALLSMSTANMTLDGSTLLDGDAAARLHDGVLQACDELDGEADGILDDPRDCTYDPNSLQCTNENTSSCLTAAQVKAAQSIYRGALTSDGTFLAYGPMRGSELGWAEGLAAIGSEPPLYFQIAESSLRYVASETDPGPDYSARDFDLDRDAQNVDYIGELAFGFDPDLRIYRARGGKILLYHGWQDVSVPPLNSVDYYNAVVDEMGADATDEVLKLYMIPGMNHCGGGPGASDIDWLGILEAWVEDGEAPTQVEGRGANDSSLVVQHSPFESAE